MDFLNKIFNNRKETKISSKEDFWRWFMQNEKNFSRAVRKGERIDEIFFAPLSQKLEELREGFFYITGVTEDNQIELVITPDGVIKNIIYVEELVNSAPNISGWKFKAMKPPMDIEKLGLRIKNYTFTKENLFFVEVSNKKYPDEINIGVVYENYNVNDRVTIETGIYAFIDNYLGELNVITSLDNLELIEVPSEENELIPIWKLKDFILWREKEFIEKYEGLRYDTDSDSYALLEGAIDGKHMTAVVNATLMEWNAKASHPWLLNIGIELNQGNENTDYETKMEEFEEELMKTLKDSEGYLNIGRETLGNRRVIYFACKCFRYPSKVMEQFTPKYTHLFNVSYDIIKDKYWKTLERFLS
ncbi:DUF695 domain-containing protein [Flavobacterium lindanitolerans]|uniref:Uncharacterized protein DUF695 n=1 Tax=Flavobacterium lindanitolerans TaxID=428988 RepID=A0A497UWS1_9FLAO|nr:DUF695 domain-containing protein [Flavobacterium lindanitolerans]PKW29038.1 uncharacterized protein DUF695 [Flavobacterium lindanitolerans]RLJ35460.1 uncharacterized protein DUF695 [Flavobacterium lindanitolerans]